MSALKNEKPLHSSLLLWIYCLLLLNTADKHLLRVWKQIDSQSICN